MKCEECTYCKYDNSIKEFVCSIEPDLPVVLKMSKLIAKVQSNCQKQIKKD